MSDNVIKAIRYHDFSYGHTVHEHESACANIHGHNGRVYFHCEAEQLDAVGRVIDFSVIKSTLCQWIEDNWDHKFLVYENDPRAYPLKLIDETVVIVPFNPTAENMGLFLLNKIGPALLQQFGGSIRLTEVEFFETRKCSAHVRLRYAR